MANVVLINGKPVSKNRPWIQLVFSLVTLIAGVTMIVFHSNEDCSTWYNESNCNVRKSLLLAAGICFLISTVFSWIAAGVLFRKIRKAEREGTTMCGHDNYVSGPSCETHPTGQTTTIYPPAYPQPATDYSYPAPAYPQPATAYPQPATAYPQPATAYPQPATAYPQPTTAYP